VPFLLKMSTFIRIQGLLFKRSDFLRSRIVVEKEKIHVKVFLRDSQELSDEMQSREEALKFVTELEELMCNAPDLFVRVRTASFAHDKYVSSHHVEDRVEITLSTCTILRIPAASVPDALAITDEIEKERARCRKAARA